MTNTDITTCYIGNVVPEKLLLGSEVVWPAQPPGPVYSALPLTFKVISGGTIVWKRYGGASTDSVTIKYSKNDGEWISITSDTGSAAPAISVVPGDKIQFAGDNSRMCNNGTINCFSGTSKYEAYGNVMSLLNSTGFTEVTSFTPSNRQAFKSLFHENEGILSAENLILPVKQLEYYVYEQMFWYCTNLEKGPKILAETMAVGSCSAMFSNCISLKYVYCMATDITASNCTQNWLSSAVNSTGTFVKHPNMTSWERGKDGIPLKWTVIDADI